MYKVKISGEEVGYIQDKISFEENVKESIIENATKNIDTIDLKEIPEYELKLVDRTLKTNEDEISENMQEEAIITYKYYEIAFNNETVNSVNTEEEAEELVNNIKQENNNQELNLTIIEKYTDNSEQVNTDELQVAKTEVQTKINEKEEEDKKQKEEEERINSMPNVNGIRLAYTPINGSITSRYGVSSRLRKSTHTGLDIAAKTGTKIKAATGGKVILKSSQGDYGKHYKIQIDDIVIIYAHCDKLYLNEGDDVYQGQEIAEVGSTGNSTRSTFAF